MADELQPHDAVLEAEQLDVASRKWTAVDAFVYLCKLHGSVTWTEDDHGLFPIKEVWPPESTNQMLIYPTPAKQNSSLGSPYADLLLEGQNAADDFSFSRGKSADYQIIYPPK